MDEPTRADGEPPRPLEPAPPRRRVVVIDDNQTAAQCLGLILGLEGYEVRVAHDGHSAMEVIREFRPEVVLSDIELPGLDGHELARRLRRDDGLCAGLKLLAALTAHSGAEARQCSRASGFDHHFVKPIDPEMILALLASLEWLEEAVAAEPASPT